MDEIRAFHSPTNGYVDVISERDGWIIVENDNGDLLWVKEEELVACAPELAKHLPFHTTWR